MYAVVNIVKRDEKINVIVCIFGFNEILSAEKYRISYLKSANNPALNPQNVQVIQYSL